MASPRRPGAPGVGRSRGAGEARAPEPIQTPRSGRSRSAGRDAPLQQPLFCTLPCRSPRFSPSGSPSRAGAREAGPARRISIRFHPPPPPAGWPLKRPPQHPPPPIRGQTPAGRHQTERGRRGGRERRPWETQLGGQEAEGAEGQAQGRPSKGETVLANTRLWECCCEGRRLMLISELWYPDESAHPSS